MIKSYVGLVIIFAVQHQVSSLSVDVKHRLAHRKDRMKRLQDIQKKSEALQEPMENYDLIITEPSVTALTKPILRHRHHHQRHHSGKRANVTITNDNPHIPHKNANTLRKNFSLTGETNKTIQEDKAATTTNYHDENRETGGEKATTQIQELRVATSQKPVITNQNVSHIDPFYRRLNYLKDQERNKPQKWVHCLDLISPRLKGYTDNTRAHHKQVTHRHTNIKRLIELLTVDVSKYTEEEIVSVLQQISHVDLRIFQWDYTAITMVLNVIIKGSKHNFTTLKHGIRYLFEKWHLDTSSLQTVLEQTRIFRPPCIDITGSGGFTKKAGGVVVYTKPDKPTKKHREGHESCKSKEVSTEVNNMNDR